MIVAAFRSVYEKQARAGSVFPIDTNRLLCRCTKEKRMKAAGVRNFTRSPFAVHAQTGGSRWVLSHLPALTTVISISAPRKVECVRLLHRRTYGAKGSG